MAESRTSGQEASFTVLDATTGVQQIPDALIESFSFTSLAEEVKKKYLGQVGPTIRTFYDGYELSFKFDPNNAASIVAFVSLVVAKQKGQIADEFAFSAKFGSPTGGKWRIRFLDVQFGGQSFSLAGQHELLGADIKGTGNKFTIERVLRRTSRQKRDQRGRTIV
jgi:hypothetical protein